VKVALVTQDTRDKIESPLRDRLAAFETVDDAIDPQSIARSVRRLAGEIGPVERLIGALEELQVPLGEVRDALEIPGLGADAARNFRDKARMKEVLSAAGLPCARHRRAASETEIWRFVEEVGFPLIVKPTSGSGSRGTFRVDSRERLEAALGWGSPGAGQETMLEELVVGEEHSFDSVFLDDRVVWYSTTDYLPGPLEVLEKPWIQWCVVLPREVRRPDFDGFLPIAEQALRALGMKTGLSHMEWFQREDGTYAISEVGARPPGAQFVTLMSYAHDTDFYRAWARLMILDQFEPPARPFAAGVAFLRGRGPGRIRAVRGVERAAQEVGDLAVEVMLPEPGRSTTGTYDGDGYVIVRHPETAVVREALGRIIRRVDVEVA
jgi:formate-dependent phosphoribosylglycinamide formyltransferase (GAR transformylase)